MRCNDPQVIPVTVNEEPAHATQVRKCSASDGVLGAGPNVKQVDAGQVRKGSVGDAALVAAAHFNHVDAVQGCA